MISFSPVCVFEAYAQSMPLPTDIKTALKTVPTRLMGAKREVVPNLVQCQNVV